MRHHAYLRQRAFLPEEAGERDSGLHVQPGLGRGKCATNTEDRKRCSGCTRFARGPAATIVLTLSFLDRLDFFTFSIRESVKDPSPREFEPAPLGNSSTPLCRKAISSVEDVPHARRVAYVRTGTGLPRRILPQVLKKDHLLCDDPDDCDYARGGYFTTQRAR